MLTSQYIDESVKCASCNGCAINGYGEYFKCDFCQKLFCEKCKDKKPDKKFTKSEKSAALNAVPLKDNFNCGSDLIQIEAFKVRIADYFDCNYKRCGERIKVAKTDKVNHCNRCKKTFCKQCAGNHCTPEDKEYKKFLASKGKELEDFAKAQKEMEKARAAFFKKKKEEEAKKKAEEKEKMKAAKEEAEKKKAADAEAERKAKADAELAGLKNEADKKAKEEEQKKNEEERKRREAEEKKKEEERKKEEEKKRAEEAKLNATCGPHSILHYGSTFKKWGKAKPEEKWDKGEKLWVCCVCACILANKNEDHPADQCKRCWKVFCTVHGPQHKS